MIQEHISEATALRSLNISDNGTHAHAHTHVHTDWLVISLCCLSAGFEDDVVTLILSIGRCRALRHLSLGRNFALKSRLGPKLFISNQRSHTNSYSYLMGGPPFCSDCSVIQGGIRADKCDKFLFHECSGLKSLRFCWSFAVFSSNRNLADALHRIAQLIQDEECVSVSSAHIKYAQP